MAKSFDKISDSLNTETDIVNVTPSESEIVKDIEHEQRVEQAKKDYEYTRGNLYSLIEKGQESLDGIMELAQESDSPRAYEVAGQIIKSVADTTDKLMDLQKKMKELNKEEDSGPKSVTNNALFVGSTAELAKFLKNQQ
jgi:hypothetical protein|tara:strand:- start:546 stop:962 length:417 start_codon:yes stop_codon:yes gene_type:complete